MNNNETIKVRQIITATADEKLGCDIRRAINLINAEYQQIDWEDQAFLTSVLTDALTHIENKKEMYAVS